MSFSKKKGKYKSICTSSYSQRWCHPKRVRIHISLTKLTQYYCRGSRCLRLILRRSIENRSLLQTYTSSQRPKVNGLPTHPRPGGSRHYPDLHPQSTTDVRIGDDNVNDCFLKLCVMPQKITSALHAPASRREARIFSTCSAVPFVPFSCSEFFPKKREFHVSDEYWDKYLEK
jgi:hypothetical protein